MNQPKGFKVAQSKPAVINDPWLQARPFSLGDGDAAVRILRDLEYRERRSRLSRPQYANYPRFIYKFLGLSNEDHIKDIIVNSWLYLCSPEKFNDPFDMSAELVALGSIADIYRKIDSSAIVPARDKEKKRREAAAIVERMGVQGYFDRHPTARKFREDLRNTGVACFSASQKGIKDSGPRNVLMWSHYGESHQGICVQIEIARAPMLLRQLLRIQYGENCGEVNWLSQDFSSDIQKVLTGKAQFWEYESEWRYVLQDSEGKYLRISPDAITAVIVGCRASKESTSKLHNLLEQRAKRGYPLIRLMQTVPDPKKCSLSIKQHPLHMQG